MRVPRICRPLGEQCGRSQHAVQILNGQPGFQKEALVLIELISNHIDGIKIHLIIVFMDVTGNLRVMVEHTTALLCSAIWVCSLRLAIVHKITAGATDSVHYASFWAVNVILSILTVFNRFLGDLSLLLS